MFDYNQTYIHYVQSHCICQEGYVIKSIKISLWIGYMDIIKGKKLFDNIVTGFALSFLGQILSVVMGKSIYIIILGTLGWYYIIKGYVGLNPVLKNPFRGGYRFLWSLYLLLCFILIIRGYIIDYQYPWVSTMGMINQHVFVPTYILCYLMPFFSLIPAQYYSFDKIIKWSVYGYLIYIGVVIILFPQLIRESMMAAVDMRFESETSILSILDIGLMFSFIPLCHFYIKKNNYIISLVGLTVALITSILCARRGLSAIFVALFILLFWSYSLNKRKRSGIPLLLIVLGLVSLFYWLNDAYSIFDYIEARGFEDTRSGVEDALMGQMSLFEKFFGKGLNGRYYYPLGGLTEELFHGYRYSIETGFYNLVLKGGFLFAITYIILLLIPAVKGIMKSNNILCKVGGAYIFLSILELYPFGLLAFNFRFLIIWMCIVICMNPQIRKMNDFDVFNAYFK